MGKILLVIGILQLIAGGVIVGLDSKEFADTVKNVFSNDLKAAENFRPILGSLLVMLSGLFGILTVCCSDTKKMDVIYLISATMAAIVTASSVWDLSLQVYDCQSLCGYSKESQTMHIILLVFNGLSCVMSILGMVSSSLVACRL